MHAEVERKSERTPKRLEAEGKGEGKGDAGVRSWENLADPLDFEFILGAMTSL